MVELIIGNRGKGKTKVLLDRAESDLKNSTGNIIFVDKDLKHIHGLDYKIRLVDMSDFDVQTTEEFMGFVNGIISQNNDIEEIILDSFLSVAYIDTDEGMIGSIERIKSISERSGVKFLLSVSRDKEHLPDVLHDLVVESL